MTSLLRAVDERLKLMRRMCCRIRLFRPVKISSLTALQALAQQRGQGLLHSSAFAPAGVR